MGNKRIFYDLSEPISEDDPSKIRRLKLSYRKEKEGDCMFCVCLLLFAVSLLLYNICW